MDRPAEDFFEGINALFEKELSPVVVRVLKSRPQSSSGGFTYVKDLSLINLDDETKTGEVKW